MPNKVRIKDYTDVRKELVAAAAITPGMLVERDSAGKAKAHATAGGTAVPMFAEIDDLQGNTLNDNYATGAIVPCQVFRTGDEVLAILKDGESVAIGDKLESSGAGFLVKHVADEGSAPNVDKQIVATALEAMDLSDSSGAEDSSGVLGYNKRIKVEVI